MIWDHLAAEVAGGQAQGYSAQNSQKAMKTLLTQVLGGAIRKHQKKVSPQLENT